MSFDLSNLPTKTQFDTSNPVPAPLPSIDPEEVYNNKKNRLQTRLINFFHRSGSSHVRDLELRIAFLTSPDKNELISAIEAKGYTCTEKNGFLNVN